MIQDDELEASRRRLTNGLRIASGENPDVLAADRREATRLGVSVGALRLARQQGTPLPPPVDLQELPRTAPRTTSFLSEPSNAAVAHDDIDNLTGVEGVMASVGRFVRDARGVARDVGANFVAGVPQMATGFGGLVQAATETGKYVDPFFYAEKLGLTPSWFQVERSYETQARVAASLRDRTQALGTSIAPQREGLYGAALSGVRSIPQTAVGIGISLIPGVGAGAGLSLAGGVSGGEAFSRGREQGLALPEALNYAAAQGSAEVVGEAVALPALIRSLKAGSPFLKTLIANQINEQLGEQVTTAIQNFSDWGTLNPEKTVEEYLAEQPGAMAETAVATLVGSGTTTAAIAGANSAVRALATREERRARTAQADGTAVDQIKSFAEQSKLRERSPETFEQFIAEAAQGGPVENLYIDGNTLNQALQDAGLDAGDLSSIAPAVAEQLANAVQTGGDVLIPVEQFAARVVGTDFAQPLLDHLRVNPLLPSRAEVQNASSEELRATVEQILVAETTTTEFKASAERVKASFVEQLTTAGRFTNDVNTAYATLVSDFYTVQAARLGITPEAMAERYPLRIRSENPGAPREQVLDQPVDLADPAAYDAAQNRFDAENKQRDVNDNSDEAEALRVAGGMVGVLGNKGGKAHAATGIEAARRAGREDLAEFILARAERTIARQRQEYAGKDLNPMQQKSLDGAEAMFAQATEVYGAARAATSEMVSLSHFSKATGLAAADPSRWGMNSATPAGERQRVGTAPGRTYFYDRSLRQEPEGAIRSTSPFQYAAKIPRASLYDFDADPQRLRTGDASAYEAAIQAAGFKGYFSNATIEGAVAVFDALPLEPVGAVRTQEDAAFVSRRMRELQQADRLARVAESPGEMVTAQPIESFRRQAELEIPLAGAPRRAKIGDQTIQVVPSAAARQAALNYMEQRGLEYLPPREYAKVDTARAQRIATAFDEMAHAPNDPLVRAAYRAMIDETLAQYQAIKATGLEIEFIDFAATGDPYALTPRQAIQDVVENNHLWVFPTDEGFGSDDTDITGNPLLEMTDEFIGDRQLRANDVFRIVHDYFGHIKDGNGFRADGEENAWQSHAAMYTPLARRAMTTETRGQNSWVNYGPNGESNRTASAADTVYAPQKIGLLPQALSEEGFLGGGSQTFNQGPTEREQRLIDEIPGLKAVLPNLTQDEKAKLRRDTAAKIVAMIDEFPSAEEMAAVAYSGRAKRGWYENSAQAILEIFGTQDAPRFAALLAALSPQTSVEANLFNALATWTNWINDGRPTDRKALVELMGKSVQGKGTTESVLGAWINNSVTALTTENPADITLSGPKVNSFMLNLIGVVDEVTNDAWMANYAFVPQTKFKKTGASPGKGPGYIAMNAVVREAAAIVSEKTGQTWTPAEVQETVWSWAKTLYEKRDSAGENRTTQQLLAAGGLTAEEIAATPDFALLFTDGVYRRILEAGGYGQQIADLEAGGQAVFSDGDRGDPRSAEGTGFAEADFQAFLDTAAGRLEQLRTSRREEEASSQGTLFQSDPTVGQPPFYSALARAVSENQTKRASAEQWKATLAKTPGVKKDEIEWSGVNDWLDGQVGAVDREALATYLQQGGVQLEEVVLGAGGTSASEREVRTLANEIYADEDLDDYEDAVIRAEQILGYAPAQFSNYKLPGADDSYREVLLTLPAIQGPSTHWDTENVVAHARITERADATGARVLFIEEVQSDWHQKGRDEGYAGQATQEQIDAAEDDYAYAINNRDKVRASYEKEITVQLEGTIAQLEAVRAEADAAGGSVAETVADQINMFKDALSFARRGGDLSRLVSRRELAIKVTLEMDDLRGRLQTENLRVREAELARSALQGGIPDAPFRTSWSTLVMKRMIRYAVDNGFEKVAWINGNQQNGGQTGGDGSFFYERNLVNTTNDLLKKLGGRVEQIDFADPDDRADIEERRRVYQNGIDTAKSDAISEYYTTALRQLENVDRPIGNLGVQNGFTINDRIREVAAGGFPLFQQNRGQITFGQDITQTPSTISLLRTADLSTFLHETGHFFLEVQAHIANSADAPAEVVADMEATLNWFRPGMTRDEWSSMSLDAKREFHEKFARGFEAYLLEGNAPTSGLRDVFRRFRSWLLNVYKSMTALNVELTDEVRQVMGRMVGSAEAIKEAEDEMSFAPLFESRPPFMNEAAWAEYQRSFASSTEAGMDTLTTRSARDMQWLSNAKSRSFKLLQRDAREARKQVKAEVTAEVRAEPVNRARAFLTRGLDGEGNPAPNAGKLDIDALRQMYGEETTAMWRGLKVGGKFGEAGKDGLNPDAVAELFGFESGDALVRALVSAEDMNAKIAGMTDQRMLERYGDISDEQALDRAANESVANDARARFVATEFAALAQATGQPRALAEAARQYAAGIVNKMVLKRLKPAQFFAAQTRAARAADKALKADDLVAAATQKRNQLINLQAARYTIKAQADVDKALRLFTRIVSAKDDAISRTRDMNLVNASRAILAAHGIGRVKNDPISYMDLVKRYDPAVYADLQPYVETAMRGAKNVEEMTFEEFQGMRDSVAQLWALSRRTKQIVIDGQTMQLEAVREELSARLDEIMPAGRTGMTEDPDEKARIGRSLQGIRAAMRRVESWARATDGGDKGPFRRYIWNPISEAADRYRVAQTTYLQRYLEVIKPIEETLTNARIAAPEINHTFNGKAQLLHAILHTGNLSNKSKLLLGRSWGKQTAEGALDSTTWDALVERFIAEGTLTKADFDVVQAIWDLMEETKPGAQQAHQAIYGRFFAEVTADEVVTSLGTYRGGYVPALTDSFFVQDAALREEQRALEESDSAMFPAASNGFTKARVEDYTRELALDMRLLPMHIDKVLRFTHMGPPVRDVARLLKGKALSQKMHAFDPVAQTDLLLPWLQRAATQQVQTPSKGQGGKLIDSAFRTIRSRVGMQLMFANVSNTLQQVTGFSSLLARVKQARLRDAMWTYVRDPKGTADAVVALSSFMATRTSGQMFEVRQSIDQMLMNPTQYEKLRDFSSRHGYFMQTMAQNFVDVIGWTAAYNQAVARGDNDLEAVRFADSVIRETQGSMAAEDVSRFETGSAFTRLFTQFVGYFNMTANLNATEFLNVQRGVGVPKGAGRLAYVYAVAFAIPALLADLIAQGFRGELGDEDDDGYMDDFLSWFFGSQGKFALAMIPGAGPAALAAIGGFTEKPFDDKISLSPGISVAESSVRAPSQVYKTLVEGESFGRRDVRDTMTFLGLLTGTPLGALGRPVGYVAGVAQGEIEPTGPVDFARGVITGSASPESRE